MQLTFDLRFLPSSGPRSADELRIGLPDLAAAVRGASPTTLVRLLRGRRYEAVRLITDSPPPSGVQAAILVLATAARAQRFELETPGGVEVSGRVRFAARALAIAAAAVPRELWLTYRLYRRVKRVAGGRFSLPRTAESASSVAYLRTTSTIHDVGSYVGGAATHTTGVVNGLLANGVDVRMYAPEQPPDIEGARLTQVPMRRVYHFVHWLTFADYTEGIVDAAAGERTDFVYHRCDFGSWAGLELAQNAGVPLVLEFNGSEVWASHHWGNGALPFSRLLLALEERNLQDASLIVVVSEVLKEQLEVRGVSAERILVNPNGVDVDRLAPLRERAPHDWRAELELPEAPTVGFVGSFGLWHGVRLLPRLIEAVARERPDCRWILVGGGLLYDEVAAEIEARRLSELVLLTGVVPHDQALPLLAACDVCVSPHVPNADGSRFFGSPTKLFEYMGLAKPIVASDLEQIGEVLDDGRTGLLCPPGDVDAATEAVVRLLDDQALRKSLGEAALEKASTTYSWEMHARRILEALTARSPSTADTPPAS